MRLVLLLFCAFILAACSRQTESPQETAARVEAASLEKAKKENAFKEPVTFARYRFHESLQLAPNQLQNGCHDSTLFRSQASDASGEVDFCGPRPKAVADLELHAERELWTLPHTPDSFYWQQRIDKDHRLSFELIDDGGLPWPCETSLSEIDGAQILKLTPSHELPKQKQLYLVGTLFNPSGQKSKTWIGKVAVDMGFNGDAIWNVRPIVEKAPVKKAAAGKKKKRRR